MKWRGGRQSTNVEDRQLDPLPNIQDGEIMFGTGEMYHPDDPKTKQQIKEINAAKEVGRLGKTKPIPVPLDRPKDNGTHDNLVTPGKWKTKTN